MLENMTFTFNGIDSESMGVTMINSGSGLYKDIFLPTRKTKEVKIGNRIYFKGVEREQLSFPFSIFIDGWRELNNLQAITEWLDQDNYCEFWVDNDPNRILDVIIEGSSDLTHNGCKDGYATMTMKTMSPYGRSSDYIETLQVRGSSHLDLLNQGNKIIRPYLEITKIGEGDISIKNEENGQEFKITGLWNNEKVKVNCLYEEIESNFQDQFNRYLYDSHNDIWLDWNPHVETRFTFTGNFNVEFRYRLIYTAETR